MDAGKLMTAALAALTLAVALLIYSQQGTPNRELDPFSREGCEDAGGYYREDREETSRMQKDDLLGWRELRTIQISRICDIVPQSDGADEEEPGPLEEISDLFRKDEG